MVRQTLCLKMADKYHQHLRGGVVGKWQKFRPFSNNLLRLFENGRKQTINHLVGILLENGRNFCRFLTTTSSCLKTAENKPSTILWGLCWKMAKISAVFQQPKMFWPFSNKEVSTVFLQFFSAVFHIPYFSSPKRVSTSTHETKHWWQFSHQKK